ncbi:MAG: hypothetical protein IJG87_02180 [Ruminococcus sp.]|nr:hypothetical protein [Ruminococcus sp.]
MKREEAYNLMVLLDTLWPRSGLPDRSDHTRVEAWKTEACNMLEGYSYEEVAEVCREIARSSEWMPKFAAILKGLQAKTGEQQEKGARYYQYDDWFTDAEGYECVRSYTITKTADGKWLIPKGIRRKATRVELLKRRILTTDDLIRWAEDGTLTLEEFETIRDENNKPVDGEWKLDHYTFQPERVLSVLKGRRVDASETGLAKTKEAALRSVQQAMAGFTRADNVHFGEKL